MSTPIERLIACERGFTTSVEFALTAPLFLLLLAAIWDLSTLQSARLQSTAAIRTAAWAEARLGLCRAPLVEQRTAAGKVTREPVRCTRRDAPEAARFWRDLDAAGGENLTRDVARARPPQDVTAEAGLSFRFHPELHFAAATFAERHVVPDGRTFTVDDVAIARGFDPVLHDRFAAVGSFVELIPEVFPRARR